DNDWERAADLYRQALRRATTAAAQASMALAVRQYAALLGARGEHRRALRLLGALARRPDLQFDRDLPRELSALVVEEQRIMDDARTVLGDRAYTDAWAEGEAMTLEQVSAEIL